MFSDCGVFMIFRRFCVAENLVSAGHTIYEVPIPDDPDDPEGTLLTYHITSTSL